MRQLTHLDDVIRAEMPEERPFANYDDSPASSSKPTRPKFTIEPFESIKFDACEEWLVKRLIPRRGVGVFYGASQSFKSFVVSDLAWRVALGWEWAGRRVEPCPTLYIAAEGAAGLRKRKVGFEIAHPGLPAQVPFSLIPAAPNLGTERGDLELLIAAIEGMSDPPSLIIIDTLAQSLAAGDENGGGMIQFVRNATALANHFNAFVLIVHHVGLGDDKRMRGHSSLIAGIDAQILCERREGELSTSLTLQKLKDEESNLKFTARLARVVVAQDEDGEDVSTLVVDTLESGTDSHPKANPKSVPRSQRLLMDVIETSIEESGESFRPFGEVGPIVRGASEKGIRARYYSRMAETAELGEDRETLLERQSKAFRRSIKSVIESKTALACERNGERFVWLP